MSRAFVDLKIICLDTKNISTIKFKKSTWLCGSCRSFAPVVVC